MMKILIVTYGFTNRWTGGLYSYFHSIAPFLIEQGHELFFFDGDVSQLTQPEWLDKLPFAVTGLSSKNFGRYFEKIKPDAVHIQTEFGIGIGARQFCMSNQIPFSSAYHTNWGYFAPKFLSSSYLNWFYSPAAQIFVHTPRIKNLLQQQNIKPPIVIFPPGVNRKKWFYEPHSSLLQGYPRPYFISMSRISREKNLEAFLDLELPGTKFVIGEGPDKGFLAKKYLHKAIFLPYENARYYLSESDVFIVPARFDTFNLTILEALSCGLPVATYPVMGPLDIIQEGISGFISEDLQKAALSSLSLKKDDAIALSEQYSWEKTAEAFAKHQILIR